MNLIEIQNKIISEKIKLRKKSKNVVNNFKKIEKYIQKEVTIIKESKDTIIPEIEFDGIKVTSTFSPECKPMPEKLTSFLSVF